MENQEATKKKIYKKWWFWVIVVLVLAAIGNTSSESVSQGNLQSGEAISQQPREAIVVTALKLYTDYDANEVAADAKYKGNLVRVSGTVGSIGKDVLDTPYVTLSADQYDFKSVQCMFGTKDSAVLAELSKGQQVTLEGEVSGKSLTNVLVRSCRVVN